MCVDFHWVDVPLQLHLGYGRLKFQFCCQTTHSISQAAERFSVAFCIVPLYCTKMSAEGRIELDKKKKTNKQTFSQDSTISCIKF